MSTPPRNAAIRKDLADHLQQQIAEAHRVGKMPALLPMLPAPKGGR